MYSARDSLIFRGGKRETAISHTDVTCVRKLRWQGDTTRPNPSGIYETDNLLIAFDGVRSIKSDFVKDNGDFFFQIEYIECRVFCVHEWVRYRVKTCNVTSPFLSFFFPFPFSSPSHLLSLLFLITTTPRSRITKYVKVSIDEWWTNSE